jgi:DNA-binding transcriptional regulator/RsmH inhibitor MraZ
MEATVLDDRRRLVLPAAFKPKSAVTVQMIDEDTVIVKLAKPSAARMVMLLPDVKHFAPDPEWEKVEAKMSAYLSKQKVAPFEE